MRWDLFVRLFHWSLVAGVLTNYWLLDDGDTPHEWLGYALVGLVVVRIFWGFRGPQPSRFSSFIAPPRVFIDELKSLSKTHELPQTHTTAGGYQLLGVLALVIALGLTGWIQDLDAFWGEDWPQELHEYLAHSLLVIGLIHVLTVIWMQLGLKRPLLQRMWFGRKQ